MPHTHKKNFPHWDRTRIAAVKAPNYRQETTKQLYASPLLSEGRKPIMSVCCLPPSCSECRTSLQGTVPEERSLPAFSKRGAPRERPSALRDSGRAREARRGRKSRASCPVWAAPQNCPGAAPLPGDRVWRAGRRGRGCRDRRGGARDETPGSPTP